MSFWAFRGCVARYGSTSAIKCYCGVCFPAKSRHRGESFVSSILLEIGVHKLRPPCLISSTLLEASADGCHPLEVKCSAQVHLVNCIDDEDVHQVVWIEYQVQVSGKPALRNVGSSDESSHNCYCILKQGGFLHFVGFKKSLGYETVITMARAVVLWPQNMKKALQVLPMRRQSQA